ncbi:proteasome stabiliser-domain-containing protein [Dipodascopsis uninucleata]
MASTELALVNKVELRIALANTNDKLESLLKIYLAPLLLKLGSSHEVVRNKVVSICDHIDTRIKSSDISLPAESLLVQFQNPKVDSDPTLVRNYSLKYLSAAIERLSSQEQANLVPEVVKNISKYGQFQQRLFAILLKLLPNYKMPAKGSKDEDNLREKFGFIKNTKDSAFLSFHFRSLFLLQGNLLKDLQIDRTIQMPGLHPSEVEFLTFNSKDTFTPQQLTRIKAAVLNFCAGLFNDYDRFLIFLTASQDKTTSVSEMAEGLLKKVTVDYEEQSLVNELYSLFLGGPGIQPVPFQFRLRILQLLSRSAKAANTMPSMVDTIRIGIVSTFPKERLATVEFVRWTARQAADVILEPIARGLVDGLRNVIESTGLASEAVASAQDAGIRGFAFETIGLLCRRVPTIFSSDLGIIEFLFNSLQHDSERLRPSIQESLSSIIPVLDRLEAGALDNLRQLLLRQIKLGPDNSNCQFLALRYTIAAFPFSDPLARYVCILGLDKDNKGEVISEAEKGLNAFLFRKLHRPELYTKQLDYTSDEYIFPKFKEMLDLIFSSWNESYKFTENASEITVPLSVFIESLKFLREILLISAWGQAGLEIDEGYKHKLEDILTYNEKARADVVALLGDLWATDTALQAYMNAAFQSVCSTKSGLSSIISLWVEFLCLGPSEMVFSYLDKIGLIETICLRQYNDDRILVAHALGLIASLSHAGDGNVSAILSRALNELETGSVYSPKLDASILIVGYLLSRLNARGKLSYDSPKMSKILDVLIRNLESSNKNLLTVTIVSITQLALYKNLRTCEPEELSRCEQLLFKLAKEDDVESAIFALAALTISYTDKSKKLEVATRIYSLHEKKKIESLFSSGESLSCIAAGWQSTVLKRSIDIHDIIYSSPDDLNCLKSILDHILESCNTTKPSLRKASSVWLLSMIQFCGHLDFVSQKLTEIHYAFMRFLGDRDEIVQEMASRGLGLVYEKGSPAIRDDLVRSLIQSFTSDTRNPETSGRVSNDTQLFEPGVIQSNEGTVSTYKDIMSLASEAGDPSLVYKFMSLASSSAIWSTRKGAAFGLGSILSKASLNDILGDNVRLSKTLIPKLYRYKFDPNPSVQQSMRDIWNILVSDSSSTIAEYFDIILEELLARIGDREWRVRQASCAALQDLLDCTPTERYRESLEIIWKMSFRALDDIKESVRVQAMSLCRSLTNISVRSIDTDGGASKQSAAATLNILLPFLLGNSGLQSDATEVQAFALDTLLKLVQLGGSELRPFIPQLMDELLGLLSTLEPQAINYIALNADKYGLTGDAIDATRLASIRSSPMMTAIDRCIDLLDQQSMKELVPKLQSTIKNSVGLPSKVACSRVLVTLVIRHLDLIRAYAERLMKVVITQFTNRNDTVASSFAVSAGYLCRVAKNETVVQLFHLAENYYFESEEERMRTISASLVSAVSSHASDKFVSLASSILPFVFLAKQDPEKRIKESFTRVWSDNTGGTGAIKLYMPEILQLSEKWLESRQWRVRQTIAYAIANASDSIGTDVPQLDKLYEVLIKCLVGRSWDGKEHVLESLTNLSIKNKEKLLRDVRLRDSVLKILKTESKRNNPDYKIHAVKCLEKFGNEFDIDITADE